MCSRARVRPPDPSRIPVETWLLTEQDVSHVLAALLQVRDA
jgi:hypothetical protein